MISNMYITNNGQIKCVPSAIEAYLNINDAYESRFIKYAEIYA